jgi:hypothetical protein
MEGQIPQQGWTVKAAQLCPVVASNLFAHPVCSKEVVDKKVYKIRRGFLWTSSEQASGTGHCLDIWANVKQLKAVSGLSVLDLEVFNRALQLRWLWYQLFPGHLEQDLVYPAMNLIRR